MIQNMSMEPLAISHCQELFELTEANRDYLREWLPWLNMVNSSADTRRFIESSIKKASTGGAPNFAILYKGAICGVAGFHEINKQHNIGCIGYWLAQNHTGKGLITAAVKALMKIGFNQFKLNKIEIRSAEENLKSRTIPTRLGFIHEATLRQCEWLYSKYVNHAVYSMLAAEYDATNITASPEYNYKR